MTTAQRPRSHGKFGVTIFFTLLTLGGLWVVLTRSPLRGAQLALVFAIAVAAPWLAALLAGRGRIPLDTSLLEWLGFLVVPVVTMWVVDQAAILVALPLYVATMCWLRVVAFR